MGCGEATLASIFEEDYNAYVTLMEVLEQDKEKEEELAQLLSSIQTKQWARPVGQPELGFA